MQSKLLTALGLLFALMIRRPASEPLEYVATSFVVANRTVVVYSETLSTNHVLDPAALVSFSGSEIAILSPMSYGRRTKMSRMPKKYLEEAGPNMNEKEKKNAENDRIGSHIYHREDASVRLPRWMRQERANHALHSPESQR